MATEILKLVPFVTGECLILRKKKMLAQIPHERMFGTCPNFELDVYMNWQANVYAKVILGL